MDERMDEWMKGWKAIRSGEIYKPFFFRDPLLTPRSLRSSVSSFLVVISPSLVTHYLQPFIQCS